MILVAGHLHFVYHQIVNVEAADTAASSIAAAIGEPARARMLYSLVDGRARTATELAAVADVTAATASVHLQRLGSRCTIASSRRSGCPARQRATPGTISRRRASARSKRSASTSTARAACA